MLLEHSAILSTVIKLPFVIMIFVLSIFEWPFTQASLYFNCVLVGVWLSMSLSRDAVIWVCL